MSYELDRLAAEIDRLENQLWVIKIAAVALAVLAFAFA